MLSKFTVPALCASLLLQGAAAANHHRHLHELQKKDYVTDVVVVTEVVTKTVYEGEEEPTPTPAAVSPSVYHAAKRPSRRPSSPAAFVTTSAQPVVVVEQTSTPNLIASSSAVAVAFPTTMVTAVITPVAEKPAAVTNKKIEEVAAVASSSVAAAAVPAPSSSAAGTSSGSSYSGSSGARKGRGIAYNDANLVTTALAASGNFHWAYNWADVDLGLKANIPFVPTCWSPGKAGNWADRAAKAIAKGSDLLFGFNECDIAEQCNLSPSAAAAEHIRLMNPFQGQALISAPSISSSWDKNKGTDWLSQFFTACGGKCAVDVCNAHWYGAGGQAGATAFLTHLKNVHSVCQGKPVYVTEFKAEDSAANEAEFIKITLKELDTNPDYDFVHGYAYFFMANGFLTTGNALNANGLLYATS